MQSFPFVSSDTTSNLLQTIAFELSLNPEIQKEMQIEIDEVSATLDGKPVSYETLHKMKYLDMVISEGLRKYPPAPQTDRVCFKDYDVQLENGKKITIKKGETIFLPTHHFHHDERFFKNPEEFDPTRFNDENKQLIVPGSYSPFGLGPRACIGQK